MQRIGKTLQEWNAGGVHADSVKRLQAQLASVCAKLPTEDAQRATCDGLLRGKPEPA